jgi:hypothetical protein
MKEGWIPQKLTLTHIQVKLFLKLNFVPVFALAIHNALIIFLLSLMWPIMIKPNFEGETSIFCEKEQYQLVLNLLSSESHVYLISYDLKEASSLVCRNE